jgi:hypothetical protein
MNIKKIILYILIIFTTTIIIISRFFLFGVVGNVLRDNNIFSYSLMFILLIGLTLEPLFILWVVELELNERLGKVKK